MELNIDTGVEEFSVNGRGVLRFNPADPNLYHRFFAAGKTLERYDAELTAALGQLGGDEQQRAAAGLALLQDYDGRIKRLLGEIFGAENDLDAILRGPSAACTPPPMRPRLPHRPPAQPGARNDGLLVPANAGRAGRRGVCDTHRLPRYSGAAALAGRHG